MARKRPDSDSDNVYSTKIDADTISGLQKTYHCTITIYSWYISNLMHVGRPPLRSYLTAGIGATRRGIACTRSERIHNTTFWRWGESHGGHHRDHHRGILTIGETPEPIWGPDIRRWNIRVPDPQMYRSAPTQRRYVFQQWPPGDNWW